MAIKYDWAVIRADYVAGTASYKDLADKYGVSYRQITQIGRDEDWPALRIEERKAIATKAIDIAADQKAESIANLMLASKKLAQRVVDDVDVLDGARDVSDIAKALKYAADTLAQLYGIQTPAQLHRQRMDEEKLKIERERLEMDKRKQEADSNAEPVRVVIVKPEEVVSDA